MRIGGARAFDAILVGDEALAVETEPAVKLLVIEEDQPCGAARRNLDIAFEAVRLIAATASGAATRAEKNEERDIAIWKSGVTL